jgi:hypothetical protein
MPAADPHFPTVVPRETVAALERVEREASAALFAHAPAEMVAKLGLHHRRIDDGLLTLSRVLDHIMICRLQGLGVEAPANAAALDAAIAAFRGAEVKNWVIQLAPGADALARALGERGFQRHPRTWAKFLYRGGPPPAARTDLAVREVGVEHARAAAEIACAAFELPPFAAPWLAGFVGKPRFHTFLAFDGERPVATGTLFVDGEAAWLGFGATLASHRGRGAQGAILGARIETALQTGAKLISTETGIPHPNEAGPSFKNIQRAGFRVVYERPNLRLG